MEPGEIVDHKTDHRWREGIVKYVVSGNRVYVEWPENADNGYVAFSPHAISTLVSSVGQLELSMRI